MKKIFLGIIILCFLLCSFVNTNNNVYAKEISYNKKAYEV